MHSILEQCYNQFLSDFSESWLPDGEDENVLFDKKSQIDSFFEVCFIQLSKSIISGEYIGTPNFIDRHFRIKTTTGLTFCFYSRFVNLKSNECDGAVALPQ